MTFSSLWDPVSPYEDMPGCTNNFDQTNVQFFFLNLWYQSDLWLKFHLFMMLRFLWGARRIWAKTLAGTQRSDMPRYLAQSDFGPFPFQSGRIMAMFQSVGMTKYFQMSVPRRSSHLVIGAPPDFRSSDVMPPIPGARFIFSFRIAADISSAVGGVESIEGSGVADGEIVLLDPVPSILDSIRLVSDSDVILICSC